MSRTTVFTLVLFVMPCSVLHAQGMDGLIVPSTDEEVPLRFTGHREGPGVLVLTPPGALQVNSVVNLGERDRLAGDELGLCTHLPQMCGNGPSHGTSQVVSGRTGRTLLDIRGEHIQGLFGAAGGVGGPRALFVLVHRNALERWVERRERPSAAPAWTLDGETGPIGSPLSVAILGDLDGDGLEDLVAGNPRALRGEGEWKGDQRYEQVGAVVGLSGADGTARWVRRGTRHESGFGRHVAGMPDQNGDGRRDALVLVSSPKRSVQGDRVEVLSGADGVVLRQFALVDPKCSSAVWAGDLNGDGAGELLLEGKQTRVVSSLDGAVLDVAEAWELAWAAPAGDLDGDGDSDLVLARRHPDSGELHIALRSGGGLTEVGRLAAEDSRWRVESAVVGDYHGDGGWGVALHETSTEASLGRKSRVRILTPARMR